MHYSIVLIGENCKLEKVLNFWRLEYKILPISNKPFLRNIKISKNTLFVSNTLPSLQMWKQIYDEPNKSHISSIKSEIIEGEWRETFCLYLTTSEFNARNFTYNNLYTTDEYDDPLFSDISIQPDIKVAWDMSSKFWYQVSVNLSRNLLLPLWIHEVQLASLYDKNISDYGGILSQAAFSRPYDYQIREGTIAEAILHLKKINYLDERGVLYKVKERFSRHSLTLPGIIRIENDKISELPNSNFTIVIYFYNLNLPKKPKIFYQTSLLELRKILHPIIFYGDDDMCKFVLKLRREANLEAYTKVIPGRYSDWKIWNPTYQYESITLLKPYILSDAISRNPFLSQYYIYMDLGIYNNEAFKDGYFTGIHLFNDIQLSDNKIKMQKLGNPVVDDISEGIIMCDIICGTKQAWNNFLPKYDELIKSIRIYSSVQKVITRLLTLYPELAELVMGGMTKKHYIQYLNL